MIAKLRRTGLASRHRRRQANGPDDEAPKDTKPPIKENNLTPRRPAARSGVGVSAPGFSVRDMARTATRPSPPRRSAKSQGDAPPATPVDRAELLRRILRAVERETLNLADRLAGDGPVDCVACDKASKNLNMLVRTMKDLDDIEGAEPIDDRDTADLDALRTELARRVAGLR